MQMPNQATIDSWTNGTQQPPQWWLDAIQNQSNGSSGSASGGGGGLDPSTETPVSDPNADTPNITTTRDANGNLVFRGGDGSGGQPQYTQGGGGGYGSESPNGYPGGGTNSYGGNGGAGGGGGGQIGMSGSSGQWAPGGGLQQYPDSSNIYGQSNMGSGNFGGSQGGSGRGGNQPLGSTVQGTPNVGQVGGGFDPNNNAFTIAKPYGGGPQTMMGQTGFKGTGAGTPSSQYGNTGFNPGANTGPGSYLTMAGFKQGGTGQPPTEAYNRYQGMLQDPTSMSANPAYKAIMDAATQATQRQQLARGGNGGGTILAELAKTGASVAGQYLPQMANMYQGGAQQEFGNWQGQQQLNLGAGQLGGNLYGNAQQANLGYGNMANNAYGLQNQANLGYGNLANNMWTNAAQDQFNRGTAYSNLASNAQNTQQAALAQAQMQPANAYFQNQLTMSGMG